MSKTRVYQLAKEFGKNSREFLEELRELGYDLKSHMSSLENNEVEAIKEYFEEKKKEAEEKKKAEKKKQESQQSKEKKHFKEKKDFKKDHKKDKKNKNKNKKFNKNNKPDFVKEEKKNEEKSEEEDIKEVKITKSELKLDILAKKLGKGQNDIIKAFFMKGKILRPGQALSESEAEEIAMMFNTLLDIVEETAEVSESTPANKEGKVDPEEELKEFWKKLYEEKEDKLVERAPVVTIMGHVDHGKTTLLDNIRNTRVAEKEAGGITQSIGAYQVNYEGRKITFIDTPGHEAFTEMRARGAQATDIVVLIIAADDGVMPQTIEAYNHAKNANVPIIVAINKIDKPNANIELTKQQMVAKLNLIPEDWGGDTITVPISAKAGQGIDELLEMILLVAEMQEIKCYPEGLARGVIIESKLDKFLGPVATAIIKDGKLKVGDYFVAGSTFGKVRRMIDPNGKNVKVAGPSDPVQILGFEEVPDMHSILYGVKTLHEAREYVEKKKELEEKTVQKRHIRLEDALKMMQEEGEQKILNIILKADTFGSLEALKNAIAKLQNPEIELQVIHGGIGAITKSDVMLATASDAVILGFRVKADSSAVKFAEQERIQIKRYDIIFNLIDDLKKALQGMLEPEEKEEITGYGEVKQVFRIKKVGNIAGIQLKEGYVERDGGVRLYRGGKLVYDGKLESLRHYKDEVKRIEAPKECGVKILNFDDINEGDEMEFYKFIQVERTLEFGKKEEE
ncbi:translation initiation factor IF-2 [Marinitoga sp. 1135]|uniref:Translation initiation factor IF-2 n=1 Tax=Marinitoga piezophila (strain DSM 14283 / JCM 11233 / KA3) TaxID=443254 RepID=H2J3C9_MARPK|nr:MULTISPECIES: translation initiation factor IF-2 [Marinitoga]AEX85745.1 translation initiation factor IF-2 [Marinitoga piezophila KA3]APT76190.1 translation initiation factor IF-2 [Marinitoga sp. 1137]NUU95949.1 translation initiation factor IF-2 [Marinitoga sp. 1135]NUU97860.1 translation initiation factor IF-2 [Marinitoga sp. 1138]